MSSGNFVIGEDLSLQGFNQYIRPNLEKYKSEITDFLVYSENNRKRILVSLIGNADPIALEQTVKISLEESLPIIQKDFKEKNDIGNLPPLTSQAHQIKGFGKDDWLFNTIGLYQDNETASKVFQNLAVKTSAVDSENKLERLELSVRYFKEKFKDF